jgi:hypothetical protein
MADPFLSPTPLRVRFVQLDKIDRLELFRLSV